MSKQMLLLIAQSIVLMFFSLSSPWFHAVAPGSGNQADGLSCIPESRSRLLKQNKSAYPDSIPDMSLFPTDCFKIIFRSIVCERRSSTGGMMAQWCSGEGWEDQGPFSEVMRSGSAWCWEEFTACHRPPTHPLKSSTRRRVPFPCCRLHLRWFKRGGFKIKPPHPLWFVYTRVCVSMCIVLLWRNSGSEAAVLQGQLCWQLTPWKFGNGNLASAPPPSLSITQLPTAPTDPVQRILLFSVMGDIKSRLTLPGATSANAAVMIDIFFIILKAKGERTSCLCHCLLLDWRGVMGCVLKRWQGCNAICTPVPLFTAPTPFFQPPMCQLSPGQGFAGE